MKLGKPHLIGSLALLAASIVYNVYVYMSPAPASRPVAGEDTFAGAPIDGGGAPGPSTPATVDPLQIAAPPNVQLDRIPDWSRTPFAHVRPEAPAAAIDEAGVAQAEPEPEEPDVRVAAILHSADRRVAMVNGRIVRPGDRVGVVTIVDILPSAVIVESPMRGRRTLALAAPRTNVERPQ